MSLLEKIKRHSNWLVILGLCLIAGGIFYFSQPRIICESHSKLKDPKTFELLSESTKRSVVLDDGKILLFGARRPKAPLLSGTMEIYDPNTKTSQVIDKFEWVYLISKLPDGNLLIHAADKGEKHSSSLRIYNPRTHTTNGFQYPFNTYIYSISELDDGRVVIGGGDSGKFKETSEIYIFDPSKNSMSLVGHLKTPRFNHLSVTLQDGQIAFIGGRAGGDGINWDRQEFPVEIFNPASGETQEKIPLYHIQHSHSALLLPNGKVFIVGPPSFYRPVSIQTYDPKEDKFEVLLEDTGICLENPILKPLPNDKILIAGNPLPHWDTGACTTSPHHFFIFDLKNKTFKGLNEPNKEIDYTHYQETAKSINALEIINEKVFAFVYAYGSKKPDPNKWTGFVKVCEIK